MERSREQPLSDQPSCRGITNRRDNGICPFDPISSRGRVAAQRAREILLLLLSTDFLSAKQPYALLSFPADCVDSEEAQV